MLCKNQKLLRCYSHHDKFVFLGYTNLLLWCTGWLTQIFIQREDDFRFTTWISKNELNIPSISYVLHPTSFCDLITAHVWSMTGHYGSVCSHQGRGGEDTPSPSHNTSTGPMSFPEGVPHVYSIILPLVPCPFCGPRTVPDRWGTPGPGGGEYPSPGKGGTPECCFR